MIEFHIMSCVTIGYSVVILQCFHIRVTFNVLPIELPW